MDNIQFVNNIKISAKHDYETFIFDERMDKFFLEKRIYTQSREKGQRLKYGDKILVSKNSVIEPYSMILSGNHFFPIGSFSSTTTAFPVNCVIGRYSSIAMNVKRMRGNHPLNRYTSSMLTYDKTAIAFEQYLRDSGTDSEYYPNDSLAAQPIIIGNDVWIGQNVVFTSKGVRVGDGAVIAAESIVTKDVPPYAVVGGNPARILKYRFPDDVIDKLVELKWWQYDYGQFNSKASSMHIEEFILDLEKRVDSHSIQPYRPKFVTIEDFRNLSELAK